VFLTMDDTLPTDALRRLPLSAGLRRSSRDCRRPTSDRAIEIHVQRSLELHRGPTMTLASLSGEPALMKLELFRRSVELVE